MVGIILYRPEKPGNVGNIIRTCMASEAKLFIIGPLTFSLTEKELQRAGMDYIKESDFVIYKDYDEFLKDELEFRRGLYPPFMRLLRVVISDKSEQKASAKLDELVSRATSYISQKNNAQIIGHGKCGIEYIGAKHRFEILIRSSSHHPLLALSRLLSDPIADVDIDPISFS